MKWLQLLCGFRKSRDRRARNRQQNESPVAAVEVRLEDRILLSAVSPTPEIRSLDELTAELRPMDEKVDAARAASPDPQHHAGEIVDVSAQAEPVVPPSLDFTNSYSTSDRLSFDGSEAGSWNGTPVVESPTESLLTSPTESASGSNSQQFSSNSGTGTETGIQEPNSGDQTSSLTELPDAIRPIEDLNLDSVFEPAPNDDLSVSEKAFEESTDQISDEVSVQAKADRTNGTPHLNSATSASGLTQPSVDGTSQPVESYASSNDNSTSTLPQRKAQFGRAYRIVSRKHDRSATGAKAVHVSAQDLKQTEQTESAGSLSPERAATALLKAEPVYQEASVTQTAAVRISHWLAGQTPQSRRLTILNSSMALAIQREHADAGSGRSQGPAHESETHVQIRIESAVIGLTTEVDADDNPPERPEVSGVWQSLKFDCNPRGPPDDDRIPISGFSRRTGSGDQLHQLRFSIAPRGPSVAFRS